jgi:hypothetical protein
MARCIELAARQGCGVGQMRNMVRNYDGGITAFPAQLVSPGTVPEIQSVLRDAERYPGPVRAMGSYHP